MRVYHGTIREYADKIKREGLQPEQTEAFELSNSRGIPLRAVESVQAHVTPSLTVAKQYARFRAAYERANRGEWITGTGFFPPFEKITDEVKPDARAAIVTFTLPEGWELTIDKQDHRGEVTKPIPAEYVSAIREVL